MGKAFAGLIRIVIVLALAGGVAYNYFEISRLRAEIASLKAETRANERTPPKRAAPDSAAKPDSGTMIAVQRNAERAQEFIRKQDYASAKRELEQAASRMTKAGADARDQTTRTLEQLRRTVSELSIRAEQFTGSAQRVLGGKQSEKSEANGAKSN